MDPKFPTGSGVKPAIDASSDKPSSPTGLLESRFTAPLPLDKKSGNESIYNYQEGRAKYDEIIEKNIDTLKDLEYKEHSPNIEQLRNIGSQLEEYSTEIAWSTKEFNRGRELLTKEAMQDESVQDVFDQNKKELESNISSIKDFFYSAIHKEIDKTRQLLKTNPDDDAVLQILSIQEDLLSKIDLYFSIDYGRNIFTDNKLLGDFGRDFFGTSENVRPNGELQTTPLNKYVTRYLSRIPDSNTIDLIGKFEANTKLLYGFRSLTINIQQLTAFIKTARQYVGRLKKENSEGQDLSRIGSIAIKAFDAMTMVGSPDFIDRSGLLFDPQNIFKTDVVDRISANNQRAATATIANLNLEISDFKQNSSTETAMNRARGSIINTEIAKQLYDFDNEKNNPEIQDLAFLYKVIVGEIDFTDIPKQYQDYLKIASQLVPGSRPFADNILPYVAAYKKLKPIEDRSISELDQQKINELSLERSTANELYAEFLVDCEKETNQKLREELEKKVESARKKYDELDAEIKRLEIPLKSSKIISVILEHFNDEQFHGLGYKIFDTFQENQSIQEFNVLSPKSAARLMHQKDPSDAEKRVILEKVIQEADISEFLEFAESAIIQQESNPPTSYPKDLNILKKEELRRGRELRLQQEAPKDYDMRAEPEDINPENNILKKIKIDEWPFQLNKTLEKYEKQKALTREEEIAIYLKARSILRTRIQGQESGVLEKPLEKSLVKDFANLTKVGKAMTELYSNIDAVKQQKIEKIENDLNKAWQDIFTTSPNPLETLITNIKEANEVNSQEVALDKAKTGVQAFLDTRDPNYKPPAEVKATLPDDQRLAAARRTTEQVGPIQVDESNFLANLDLLINEIRPSGKNPKMLLYGRSQEDLISALNTFIKRKLERSKPGSVGAIMGKILLNPREEAALDSALHIISSLNRADLRDLELNLSQYISPKKPVIKSNSPSLGNRLKGVAKKIPFFGRFF